MNVMEKIFKIRSCIEISYSKIDVYSYMQRSQT